MKLTFFPVTNERWEHFEELFECKGSPHYCWCMLWRANEYKEELPGKIGKKESMKTRVADGTPIGLLGYYEEIPVAWCSVAPRESYRKLGGDDTKQGVWSLTCFFVKRPMRNKGATTQLLRAAIRYDKENGAHYLEAYPVAPDSPTYRYMGVTPIFEDAGFEFVKKAGKRRNVMILKLS